MDQTIVLLDRVEESVILTLNRPEAMNSFNFALLRELRDQVEKLDGNPEVREIMASNAYRVAIPTEDRLEGLAAFSEKRRPVYKGR